MALSEEESFSDLHIVFGVISLIIIVLKELSQPLGFPLHLGPFHVLFLSQLLVLPAAFAFTRFACFQSLVRF